MNGVQKTPKENVSHLKETLLLSLGDEAKSTHNAVPGSHWLNSQLAELEYAPAGSDIKNLGLRSRQPNLMRCRHKHATTTRQFLKRT